MQFDRQVGSTRVINAGSVGEPFGEAGAYWVVLGPDVELRHTCYDLSLAAERIAATTYPHVDVFVHGLLYPPSEGDMLELFRPWELT